ncbi:MAG: TCR/Tet family MFS transporter [Caulobacteraceae bacterium]
MTSETTSSSGRRPAFGFIFATAVMNSLSFGIMIPVLPNLIKSFTGGDTAQASLWAGLFAVTWGTMQFFIGPILGMMSDRFGRRPVVLISLFGLAVDFLFMAFAPTLMWLFVGRILNGATAASFSTANAYVADVTTPEKRAKDFGMMSSAFSFGFLIGPAVGGFLADYSLRLPFLVAAGLTAANWLYGFFVLPESLPPERRVARFDWKKANPVGALRLLQSHHELLGLAAVVFLFQLAHTVLPAIFVLYTGERYHWTPSIMGLTMALTGALGIVVQSFLIQPIVKRVGERGAVLIGAASGAAGFLIYASAPNGWVYIAGTVVFAFNGLLMPGLVSLMSQRVGWNEQGQLQGANQSLQGIASTLGPALFNGLFALAISNGAGLYMPGLPVYLASALVFCALLTAMRTAQPLKASELMSPG